jgi:tetratricopeptide (TPR) repeat protein
MNHIIFRPFCLSLAFFCFFHPGFGAGDSKATVSKAVKETCQNAIIETVPELPQRVGDSIPFKIQIQFRNFPFQKITDLVIGPEVHYGKKVVSLQAMRFRAVPNAGQRNPEEYDDGTALLTRNGIYAFEHDVSLPYEVGIEVGTLEARITVIEGPVSEEIPLVRISNRGFSSFSRLLEPTLELMDLDYQKEKLCVKESYKILFPAGRSELNDALNQGAVNDLLNSLRSSKEILEIQILGSASPDGESSANDNLAFKRMEALNKLIIRELLTRPVNPLNSSEVFADGFLSSRWIEQPWDSLLNFVSPKNGKAHNKLKAILSNNENASSKQDKLEKLMREFPVIKDSYFPILRGCTIEILTTPCDQSIISDLESFKKGTLSKKTSCTRLIQMALASESTDQSSSIYKRAADIFPEDYRPHFKLGILQYQDGKFAEAERLFQQAAVLNPKSAESFNNLGACQAVLNKLKASLNNFEQSDALQRPSPSNKGYASARMGAYEAALLHYSDGSFPINNAICLMGLNRHLEAVQLLSRIENRSAKADYLLAIAGARINDIALVCDQLKSSIQKDIQLRGSARTEAEFNPYRLNSQFREAIKLPADYYRSNP